MRLKILKKLRTASLNSEFPHGSYKKSVYIDVLGYAALALTGSISTHLLKFAVLSVFIVLCALFIYAFSNHS